MYIYINPYLLVCIHIRNHKNASCMYISFSDGKLATKQGIASKQSRLKRLKKVRRVKRVKKQSE